MAVYRPDLHYVAGLKALKTLDTEDADSIRYVVEKKDARIKRLEDEIEEMKSIF